MSDDRIDDEKEGVLAEIEEDLKKEIHHHNLFPLLGGGFAVFALTVAMVVAMPYMFYTGVPSAVAHNYTAQQEHGRSLYLSLGCFYCHSQFVRAQDWVIGNTSSAGDYVYDNPHSLGTERTGPDLAQIGGMRPTLWHVMHEKDPRSVSPGSIMPNFSFLPDSDLEDIAAYLQTQGTENLDTMAFQPSVPAQYANASNPYEPLMKEVARFYNVTGDTYTGDPALGDRFAVIFDEGKEIFTARCIACHGCSGNGQGPYARHVLTRPANLNERISNYPGEYFHLWRVSEGVPGTAMPSWKLTLNETERFKVMLYELSFARGSPRTFDGALSDEEGDVFANATHITPPIAGTREQYEEGKSLYELFCAQCHGVEGHGDGPASSKVGGYIVPKPANFTESGGDFQLYGRYVWKVKEGVETTNMPPWKLLLTDAEVYRLVFYVQGFSTPEDYNSKWGPQYSDDFARNLMGGLS